MTTSTDTTTDTPERSPFELATALGATPCTTDEPPSESDTDSSSTIDLSESDISPVAGDNPETGAIEPIPALSRFPHTDSATTRERAQYRHWTALVQAPVREAPVDARHLYRVASRVPQPPTTGQFEYVYFMIEEQHSTHYVVDAGTDIGFIPQFDAAAVRDVVSASCDYHHQHAAATKRVAKELDHLVIERHDLDADAFNAVWIQQTLVVEFPAAPLPLELQPLEGAGPEGAALAATVQLDFTERSTSHNRTREWSAPDGWRPWQCH